MSDVGRTITTADELFSLPAGTILRCTGNNNWPQALVVGPDTWIDDVPQVDVSGDERPLTRDDAHLYFPAVVVYQLPVDSHPRDAVG